LPKNANCEPRTGRTSLPENQSVNHYATQPLASALVSARVSAKILLFLNGLLDVKIPGLNTHIMHFIHKNSTINKIFYITLITAKGSEFMVAHKTRPALGLENRSFDLEVCIFIMQ